jgi:hypothetical protein
MAGIQFAYGANERESGLSAVSLRPCEPLALIPVNGQKHDIGGEILDRKMAAARAPGVAGRLF